MQSNLDREVRQRLADCLSDEMDIETFEEWLVPAAWDLTEQGGTPIISSLLLLLAERSEGHWTPEQLRRELLAVLNLYPHEGALPIVTASTSPVILDRVAFRQIAVVGTAPEEVSA